MDWINKVCAAGVGAVLFLGVAGGQGNCAGYYSGQDTGNKTPPSTGLLYISETNLDPVLIQTLGTYYKKVSSTYERDERSSVTGIVLYSGVQRPVSIFDSCYSLRSNLPVQRMYIPTQYRSEWLSFLAYTPKVLTVSNCSAWCDADGYTLWSTSLAGSVSQYCLNGCQDGACIPGTCVGAAPANATFCGVNPGPDVATVTRHVAVDGSCLAGAPCEFSCNSGYSVVVDASGVRSCGCQPQCTGKVCGDDGCGGTCGTCVAGRECTVAGQCAPVSRPINSCAELQLIGNQADYPLDGNYSLVGDIDCADTVNWNGGKGFLPIGIHVTLTADDPPQESFSGSNFVGTFDGQGFAIRNLYINRPAQDDVGLFALADGAQIKQLNVLSASVNGRNHVGVLSGIFDGMIENVSVSGSVVGINLVGGAVGSFRGSMVQSGADCSVEGDWKVGGLMGEAFGGVIVASSATGSVAGATEVGGLAGRLTFAQVQRSYATGAVTALNDPNDTTVSFPLAGGLVGLVGGGGASIIDAYATGAGGAGALVGGTYGPLGLASVYATGKVDSRSGMTPGGLVGYTHVPRNPAIGSVVQSPMSVGKVVWNEITTGVSAACGDAPCPFAQRLTTAEMINDAVPTNQSRFVWDFSGTWKLDALSPAGEFFPCLFWQDDATCPRSP